jgi:hypothetical protein
MSLTKNNRSYDIWTKGNLLFVISLITISLGILLLIIGYGIYPQSITNVSSDDNGLITIPKVGHINIIKDSNEYFIF